MDPEAAELAQSINDETVDIHAIGVDVYKHFPLPQILPGKIYRLCQAITADILHSAGIQKHEAVECFNAMAERIHKDRLLEDFTLEHYRGMEFVRGHSSRVVRLHASTKRNVSPPAHVMGCMIAAVAYRKLQPGDEEFFEKNKNVVKVFGELNGIQWLSIAAQVWHQVKGHPFIIELDPNNEKPVAKRRQVDGKKQWVVTTRMPDMNKYESIFRNTLSSAVQDSGPMVPKQEPDDNVLPSVEPDDTTNELIPLSDDDETEDNTITLRDYSRQMKTLAKRLTTPDRAIAKRARREILKKPDEVGEQQVDEIGPPKEFFDSYTHLKDVWKTCLQNQVSIPNSLRVLVDHHCTPSQVFHLTELEKEYIDEMEMEVDG